MKKYDKGEIAEIVLATLLVVGVVTVAAAMPNAVQIFKYFTPKSSADRARIKRSVWRLKEGGFITQKENDETFVLTEKGRARAMRYALANMKVAAQKTWDKKWRLVMFDIPEDKKQARRALNFALKRLGFAQYQRSVFIIPFPCEKEIDLIGESFDVRDSIRMVVATDVDKAEALRKVFKV